VAFNYSLEADADADAAELCRCVRLLQFAFIVLLLCCRRRRSLSFVWNLSALYQFSLA